MRVRARAPLRLGLAGGGTDVSPYCDTHGGMVLNATIDLYAYATLRALETPQVSIAAVDQDVRLDLPLAPVLPLGGPLPLHRGVYNRIVRDFRNGEPLAVAISTYCDAPAGSGLGSSSTLVVALIKAFVELLGLPLGEYDIARLAYDVERVDLGLSGGRQDQYAAAFGGVNFMEFYAGERVVVNPLRIKNWILSELEASTILYYTGASRESARIIDEQKSLMERRDDEQLAALHAMRDEAMAMKECILRGDIKRLALSMSKGWAAKKQTASSITTPAIEHAIATAQRCGAYAAKVSGAGGGGFVMLFCDPDDRVRVCAALDGLRTGSVQPCHFTKYGTQGWRVE
ncbi:MAG: dehydrogenase [Casimicrobiaceae bacterium]